MRYSIIFFGCLLLNGCWLGCNYEYEREQAEMKERKFIDTLMKQFKIINNTNKAYTKNTLFSLHYIKKTLYGNCNGVQSI